jgi:hypothetical protein
MTHSTKYDEQFAAIEHYQRYPGMYPWIGSEFGTQAAKILVLGESHFLKEGTFHHDAGAWYAGIDPATPGLGWANTRKVVGNGVDERWKQDPKGKAMYRRIDAVLRQTEADRPDKSSPFHRIAYMNYFQRPAEYASKAIRVKPLDRIHSAAVLEAVIGIIEPTLVVFCSVAAWKAASKAGVMGHFRHMPVEFAFTPHPTRSWWNRPMKTYGGKRGRDMLLEAVLLAKQPNPSLGSTAF